jgi:hypothetical protein
VRVALPTKQNKINILNQIEMAEVKEYSSYDELLEAAKEAGIKETKLDGAIESYSLTEGDVEFASIELVAGDAAHIRMKTTAGELVSTSNLISPAAFVDNKSEVKGTQQLNNPDKASYKMWFVSGTRLNGGLANDQAKLAMFLKGKKFKVEKIDGFVVPYVEKDGKADFAKTEKELQTRAVRKTFHKLTLVEN